MTRILVVEDNEELYQEYFLRLFRRLLPGFAALEIVQVPGVAAALEALELPWEIILMDYNLADSARAANGQLVQEGATLTRTRRQIEIAKPLIPAFILGTANNHVGNQLILEAGANAAFLKLQVPEMARVLEAQVKKVEAEV